MKIRDLDKIKSIKEGNKRLFWLKKRMSHIDGRHIFKDLLNTENGNEGYDVSNQIWK